MTPQEQHQAIQDGARVGGILALLGFGSWSELAAFLAALLSFLMICEWVWKKAIRPYLEHTGRLQPRRRRRWDHRPEDFADTTKPGAP